MEAVAPPLPVIQPAETKRTDLLLDALKLGLSGNSEARLFRSGKLPGLFPLRAGASGEAALAALTDGLLETVRTEVKGKLVVEWVRVTPKGVQFVRDRDSPKAVLRELREVIGITRAGIPEWMDDAKAQTKALADRFESHAARMMARLDDLAERVESALRRVEQNGFAEPVSRLVPWADAALDFLDGRSSAGGTGPCPLGDLFRAVRLNFPQLTVPEFHAGLQRLHDTRTLKLVTGGLPDPEYALFAGADLYGYATR